MPVCTGLQRVLHVSPGQYAPLVGYQPAAGHSPLRLTPSTNCYAMHTPIYRSVRGLLDMLDPPVDESGRHRGGARVALECLARHSRHVDAAIYSGRTLYQDRGRRFSTGAWPGHTTSSGGSASFVTSKLLPLLLPLLLVLVQLLRLCLMARRLQRGLRQRPGWDYHYRHRRRWRHLEIFVVFVFIPVEVFFICAFRYRNLLTPGGLCDRI